MVVCRRGAEGRKKFPRSGLIRWELVWKRRVVKLYRKNKCEYWTDTKLFFIFLLPLWLLAWRCLGSKHFNASVPWFMEPNRFPLFFTNRVTLFFHDTLSLPLGFLPVGITSITGVVHDLRSLGIHVRTILMPLY